jgi:hypothetical protein
MTKKNRVIGVVLASMMALTFTIACYAAVLDGTHGKIKVIPDQVTGGKAEKGVDDTLSFADGKFKSVFFLAKGFKPAAYNGEREENEAEFEVEQTSVTNGLINWLGEIRGKKLMGRLTWTKKDGRTLTYNFEGTNDEAVAAPPGSPEPKHSAR